MDNPLLVGMMDGGTNLLEEAQSILDAEPVAVTVLGDGRSLDILHGEIGSATVRRPGIVDLGDARVIQQCQGLPFGLETRNHPLRVHPGLD